MKRFVIKLSTPKNIYYIKNHHEGAVRFTWDINEARLYTGLNHANNSKRSHALSAIVRKLNLFNENEFIRSDDLKIEIIPVELIIRATSM